MVSTVFLEITTSLDGFVAGPNVAHGNPLGDNGERLHRWMFGDDAHPLSDADRKMSARLFAGAGAVIMGRRTFDLGIGAWGDDGAFGLPCYVLTHRAQPTLIKGPTTFTFITSGLTTALKQARAMAGGKPVCVMGGASVAHQALRARLVDELRLHVAPLLLGAGARLFDANRCPSVELERLNATETPLATHMTFRVVRPS